MRFIFLVLIFLTSYLWTKENTKKANLEEKELIVLWEGELSAVYKDGGKIQTFIPLSQYTGKNFTELKQNLESIHSFPIKQKITNKVIGTFELRHVELHGIVEKNNKKEIEVILYGKLKLRKKSYLQIVSNDFYIAVSRKEISYEDPSGFFKEKPTPPPSLIIHPKDKKEMVLIPAGLFIHGQGVDGDSDDYNPAFNNPGLDNLVDLPSYYIDKYEVTNLEYYRFLKETGTKPPTHWLDGQIPEGKEDHPVVSLTYREVEAYASWTGKRIPTEFEWEKAARGSGVKVIKDKKERLIFELSTISYPFGNKYDSKLCNCLESGVKDTLSVYELPTKGASVYGVLGMCGNAPEWTSSWYGPYQGHFFESPVAGQFLKVVRGGAFFDSKKKCTVYARSYGGLPNLAEDRRAGFRLVWDKN